MVTIKGATQKQANRVLAHMADSIPWQKVHSLLHIPTILQRRPSFPSIKLIFAIQSNRAVPATSLHSISSRGRLPSEPSASHSDSPQI